MSTEDNKELMNGINYAWTNNTNINWFPGWKFKITLKNLKKNFPFLKKLRIDDFYYSLIHLKGIVECNGYKVRIYNWFKKDDNDKDIDSLSCNLNSHLMPIYWKATKRGSSGKPIDGEIEFWMKTVFSYMWQHNVLSLNTNKLPWIFYELPYNAQNFFRIFCSHRGWGETYRLKDEVIAERLQLKRENYIHQVRSNINYWLKQLSPLLSWSFNDGTYTIKNKKWDDVKVLHEKQSQNMESNLTKHGKQSQK